MEEFTEEDGLLNIGKYDHDRLIEVLNKFEKELIGSPCTGSVNRVEVIERGKGRGYINYAVNGAVISLQDQCRTLKVFINEESSPD